VSRLELLDGTTWEGLLAAPWSVLMLGKSDCDHCNEFTEELHTFLAADQTYADVRFGKILLDRGGLASFKRANPWLARRRRAPVHADLQGRPKGRRIRRRRHRPLESRLERVRSEAG
jgi:hypothetical protein